MSIRVVSRLRSHGRRVLDARQFLLRTDRALAASGDAHKSSHFPPHTGSSANDVHGQIWNQVKQDESDFK
jgi:hypothetical protein